MREGLDSDKQRRGKGRMVINMEGGRCLFSQSVSGCNEVKDEVSTQER